MYKLCQSSTQSQSLFSKRCVVGLSGGVDSAVAALLMQKSGYHVIGCILKMQDNEKVHKEILDATEISVCLGIQLEIIDCEKDFKKYVIDYFTESYRSGLTPNPCVICNSLIKFKYLNEFRKNINAEIMATGHYARLIANRNKNKGKFLYQAVDLSKDQSYFLYAIDKEILRHTEFPLGIFRKKHVREIAYKNGLHISDKSDSQDICFILNKNYKSFLSSYIEENSFMNIPGDIIDESGKVLGSHTGILNYTVGQRKGLGLSGGPFFVHTIDVISNRVIVSDKESIKANKIYLKNVKFINEIYSGECFVKIRSSGKKIRAKVSNESDKSDGLWSVSFLDEEYGSAFGQHCVFYDDDIVLGGGEICSI